MQEPLKPGEVATHVFTAEAKPWRKNMKDYARQNRKQPTPAEAQLWQALRASQLGFRFRRQHAIGSFIVDFICIKAYLTIEVDGDVHLTLEQAEYDRGRTFMLTELGYRELRFTNDQVLHQPGRVLATIKKYLSAPTESPVLTMSSGSPLRRRGGRGVR